MLPKTEAYILKAKKFAEPLFQSKKFAEKVRKSGRKRFATNARNLAFKILRQKVRKSSRQYFATKVRKLRFQILKTEHTVPDQ